MNTRFEQIHKQTSKQHLMRSHKTYIKKTHNENINKTITQQRGQLQNKTQNKP